eukprot:TRINITY_DN330_c0_g1_i3.p1 TRINITY_DN330_c0_g1~~TRINITY_DN330_c0_g1_i3.p1  ORF type:complete len:111 (-),score=14.14 TRINITY_DN330_c0_g1_i3:174-506(-)
MTVKELKEFLKEKDVEFTSKDRKQKLLELAELYEDSDEEFDPETMTVHQLRSFLRSNKAYVPDGAKRGELLVLSRNVKELGSLISFSHASGQGTRRMVKSTKQLLSRLTK